MRKPEQRLWDRIRRNVDKAILMKRIENWVDAGTPDTIALYNGNVTWIETKIGHWPKRTTTRIQWNHELQVEQCNFHLDWHQHGGQSLIVAGIEGKVFAVPGSMADDFNSWNRALIENLQVTWSDLNLFLKKKINHEHLFVRGLARLYK